MRATPRPAARTGRTRSRSSTTAPARTVALGHNGNLVDLVALREELLAEGVGLGSTSDTEVIAALLARDPARAARGASPRRWRGSSGAYSVVAIVDGTLVAFRDPHGIRPLTLGRIGDDWVVASETCALDLVGAERVRDVRPGEVVWVDESGLHARAGRPRRTSGRVHLRARLLRPARLAPRRRARCT